MRRIANLTLAAAVAFPMGHPPKDLDISFFGRRVDTSGGRLLEVVAGVVPGVPVLFDTSSPDKIVLRPARDNEGTTDTRPVYRFEWQADKSARFFELANPETLKRLAEQNAKDSATAEGKAYEAKVVDVFFDGGKVLQACLPPENPFQGSITAFVVVAEDGQQDQVIVLPEGSVAECITKATIKRRYTAPVRRFTVQTRIAVTE